MNKIKIRSHKTETMKKDQIVVNLVHSAGLCIDATLN